MSNTLNKVFIFVAGAAVGSAVSWYILKTKYEKLVDEEVRSIREAFGALEPIDISEPTDDVADFEATADEVDEQVEREKELTETAVILQREKYIYEESTEREERVSMSDEPYVIKPEAFDEYEDYTTEFLTYYANGVLVKDMFDEVVPDREIDELVGRESLNHFGDFENDLVHVRNDRLKCDFEISIDKNKYIDVNSMVDPREMGD